MPLIRSSSRAAISKNIGEMERAGHPHKQAIAAALETAREAARQHKGKGGPVVNPPAISHVPWRVKTPAHVSMGPIAGGTSGRADAVSTQVPSGTHILPSDTVAALGDGNSMAGFHKLRAMFPRSRAPFAPYAKNPTGFAKGGAAVDGDGEMVDVNLSHGEFGVHPEDVAALGGGDPEKGHKILDKFIMHVRNAYAKKLQKLPGPSE